MRHLCKTPKLGRTSKHRESMLMNLVISLIEHKRIKTTLAKAKAVRPFAEKMVTLGKKGTLHHRRLAISSLRQIGTVHKLFTEIAPQFTDRKGGYTRIVKLGSRNSDSSKMAFLEWVTYSADVDAPKAEVATEAAEKK